MSFSCSFIQSSRNSQRNSTVISFHTLRSSKVRNIWDTVYLNRTYSRHPRAGGATFKVNAGILVSFPNGSRMFREHRPLRARIRFRGSITVHQVSARAHVAEVHSNYLPYLFLRSFGCTRSTRGRPLPFLFGVVASQNLFAGATTCIS